jgi:hypothetical protein
MGKQSQRSMRAGTSCILLVAMAMLSTMPVRAAPGPTTVPTPQPPPAEAARLDRGKRIRSLLLKLLDQVDHDGGAWPEKLDSLDGAHESLVYCRPEKLGEPGVLYQHEVVLHEPAEMEQKVETARKEVWGGRDLPFLVALDGGGRTRIPGTGEFTRGATNAAYHVVLYPTSYLIGRDGTILRDLWINNPQEQAGIEKAIDNVVNGAE